MVDPERAARGSTRIAGLDADGRERVVEVGRKRAHVGRLDRDVVITDDHQRTGEAGGDPCQLVGLGTALIGAGVGEVSVQDREATVPGRDATTDRTARLARAVWRLGEGDPDSGSPLSFGSTGSSFAPIGRPTAKPSSSGSRVSSALPHVAAPMARPFQAR